MRKASGGRRLLAAVVAAFTIAGPIVFTAQPSSAALTNVDDLGVDLQVAQTGPSGTTWQDSGATVRHGTATQLRVQVTNAGALPNLQGGAVTVDTGGQVTGTPSSGCSVDGSGATDVVTCTHGTLLPGASTAFYEIAVATPTTGILTHTATIPNEALGLPLGAEAPDTDTVTTTVRGTEDFGVDLQVAQATANPVGPTEITWEEDNATVRQGFATLLRAKVTNAGTAALGGSVAVDTGGRVDAEFEAMSDDCSVNGSGATDVVTCTYGTLLPGASTAFYEIAVATPTTGTLTHTATVPNESFGPIGAEAPDSDSVTTTVTADSGYGFITEGETVTYSNGSINVGLTAPKNLGGGGAFVNLYQGNGLDSTCGATQCAAVEARTDWVQVGGTAPTASDPFLVSVNYPGVQQTCNGVGYPSGCNPLYFLGTGVQAGTAEQIPACSTYQPSPGGGVPHADPDPCIYGMNPAGGGSVTFLVAILEDSGFPIPILGGR